MKNGLSPRAISICKIFESILFVFSIFKIAYSFRILFFLLKLVKGIYGFSFFSQNWRKEFLISLSLLDWTFWPLVND